MEKQRAQNSQLCVALRHEQTAKDNLQKELRIEASRCDALLAQEQGRAAELRRRLEAEQGHALELSEALQHERLLTERLSRRTLAVPRKPKEERARGAELQAALGEAQPHREELKREKEVSAALRPTAQALRTPRPELSCDRETRKGDAHVAVGRGRAVTHEAGRAQKPGHEEESGHEAEPGRRRPVQWVAERPGKTGESCPRGGGGGAGTRRPPRLLLGPRGRAGPGLWARPGGLACPPL